MKPFQFIKKISLVSVITALMFLTVINSCKNKPSVQDDTWQYLFDGKTLNGWKVLNEGDSESAVQPDFFIEDSMIVCNTIMESEGGYLVTDKSYDNFILEFDVKTDTSLNSGIQCRGRIWEKDTSTVYLAGDAAGTKSEVRWPAGYVWGYQVEIDPSPRAWSGGLYEPGNRGWLVRLIGNVPAQKAFRPMNWNHFRIEMNGNIIKTWVNDVPVVDTTDDMTSSGFFGIQFHKAYYEWQKDKKTYWKNIRIKEL